MKNYKSEIILRDINIKSLAKLKLLSEYLSKIEEEVCVGTTKITLDNPFICPDIPDSRVYYTTPMDKVLKEIIDKIRKK